MTTAIQNFEIVKGSTWARTLRWESLPYVYKAITAITKAAPARITAVGHSVPDGWRVAVVSVVGMREINSRNSPPRATDYNKATYVDVDTITINAINSAGYTAYTSGGYLQYMTPVSLSGFTARLMIRLTDVSTGDPLVSLTTENGGVTLDNTARTISLLISATATAALTFTVGRYDLELVSAGGVVTKLLSGAITVVNEVTRT